MFKQQKTTTTIWLIALVAIAGLIFQITEASARENMRYFTQPDFETLNLANQANQVTVSDITFRLIAAHQSGENYQVDLCFTLPDSRDWLIANRGDEVILSITDEIFFPVEEGTINWIPSPDGRKIERCEYLLFPVVVDKDAQDVKLTLRQISVSPPEMLDCPAIQNKLDEANSGIKIRCNVGNGQSGIDILANPSSMTELAARNIAYEVIADARLGPWEFEIKGSTP